MSVNTVFQSPDFKINSSIVRKDLSKNKSFRGLPVTNLKKIQKIGIFLVNDKVDNLSNKLCCYLLTRMDNLKIAFFFEKVRQIFVIQSFIIPTHKF